MAADLDVSSSQKRGRTRSPAYPYIALPNALEKAAVLWQVEGRHAAAVNVAMQHWGYKEDSSTGYSCVAALKKFGLVDHEGMGDTRQVKLSDLALAILLDKDPDSDARREALRLAALGPRIHAELWERYGTELPSDQSLKRYLVLERAFNEASVDEFLDEYKQTMTFAGLNVGTGAAAASPAAAVTTGRPTNAGVVPPTQPLTVDRRLDPPPAAPRTPPRPANGREEPSSRPAVRGALAVPPTAALPPRGAAGKAGKQRSLFGEEDDASTDLPEAGADPLSRERRPEGEDGPANGAGPWSMARKELPVPLDHDLVARVPYPMSEEDFELLIGTLQLWKKRLVQSAA